MHHDLGDATLVVIRPFLGRAQPPKSMGAKLPWAGGRVRCGFLKRSRARSGWGAHPTIFSTRCQINCVTFCLDRLASTTSHRSGSAAAWAR